LGTVLKPSHFLQEKMLRMVDNLRASRSLTIAEGIVLKGEPEARSSRKLDVLPVDPTARDAEVNTRLLDGLVGLFESHTVEVKLNEADKDTLQRSLEEGQSIKNKKYR
jgi:hypothetical protein